MCVHTENTSEPPRIDDRRQRSLFPPFSPPLPNSLLKHRRLFGFVRETMKTNDVRSNDIQRTNLTTVNDIFVSKIMNLEWPDKR